MEGRADQAFLSEEIDTFYVWYRYNELNMEFAALVGRLKNERR